MNFLPVLLFALLAVFTADSCASIALSGTREEKKKTASLLSLVILWINNPSIAVDNKKLYCLRFVSALVAIFIMLGFIAGIHEPSPQPLPFLTWPVFIFCPLYHLAYGLMSQNQLAIYASMAVFRKRSALALILGTNCWLASYFSLGDFAQAGLAALAMTAVVYYYFLMTLIRKPLSSYTTLNEDYGYGPALILHYFFVGLEVGFYSLLWVTVFLSAPLMALPWAPLPLSTLGAALIIMPVIATVVRWLFYRNSPWEASVLETRVLLVSFWFFGACFFVQHWL
jgi:hypothetical protein